MSLLVFLAFGLVVGLIARVIMPGSDPMSIFATMLLGIAGSFVGGLLVAIYSGTSVLAFSTSGFVGSVIGALGVLAVASVVQGRRHSTA